VRLGVLSDIHGNRHALEAVIADGRAQDVDRWWALGDLVAIGPEPVATLELLTSLADLEVIRGNTDRYVTEGHRPPPYASDVREKPEVLDLVLAMESSFSWTRGAVSSGDWFDWLAALDLEVRTDLPDGTRVLGVHATPGRDDGPGIFPHRPDDDLRADLAAADADIVLAGHTHQATDRRIGDVRAINLGSVGNPITDDLRATYVIVHTDRHGHRVEHRRVAYDHDAFLDALERSAHPQHEFIASFQRGEQVRHPSRRAGAPAWDD
jgi:predicted phosphodiesterase